MLIEDCAHAHGASWNGYKAGAWGDAGIWSFAPTKTVTTGEGGMVVSRHAELIEYARSFREYGKPDFDQLGLNFRMSEFTAALGILAVERLDEIERSTGKVYEEPCHRLMGHAVDLPNTDWVAQNHWCVPLYYRPEEGLEDALVP